MFSGVAMSTAFLMKRMLSCGYVGRALNDRHIVTNMYTSANFYEASPVIQLVRSCSKPDLSDGMYLGGHGAHERREIANLK
jgi:hypothetical protein